MWLSKKLQSIRLKLNISWTKKKLFGTVTVNSSFFLYTNLFDHYFDPYSFSIQHQKSMLIWRILNSNFESNWAIFRKKKEIIFISNVVVFGIVFEMKTIDFISKWITKSLELNSEWELFPFCSFVKKKIFFLVFVAYFFKSVFSFRFLV